MSALDDQRLKHFWFWLSLGYGYIVFIVYSSLTPSPVEVGVQDFDKVMHLAAYAILMTWFAMIFYKTKARIIHAIVFVCLGIGLEFAQDAGGVRHFEFSDMIANSLGVLIGYFVTRGCGKYNLLRIEQRLMKKAVV